MTISSQNKSLDSLVTERGPAETWSLSSIKQVDFKDIKTPKTVNEFRENLKKYYITVLYPKTKTTFLVTREKHIDIDEISNMDDVYKITKTGWSGSGGCFNITPLSEPCFTVPVEFTKCYERITDDYSQLFKDLKTVGFELKWTKMNNLIYRIFYIKTLGEFSGY
jgi:hypothetical protein